MFHRIHNSIFDDQSRHVDQFGWLLGLTVTAVVVQSLVQMRTTSSTTETEVGMLLLVGFVGVTFALALRASGVAPLPQRAADLTVIIGVLAAVLVVAVDVTTDVDTSAYRQEGPPLVRAALAAVTPIVVIRRLASHRQVTRGTIVGAISAYLLIALAFNYLFLSIDAVHPTRFFGEPEPSTRFMYFSLETITTLGYGDLVPASDVAGLVATSEAVVGQVFLVTFVAILVGLLIRDRPTDTDAN